MVLRLRQSLLPLLVLTAVYGCASSGTGSSGAPGLHATGASMTLEAEELGSASTSLLAALRGRVHGMQVRESSVDCPSISFRGTRSLLGENNPAVYVDGVRATNTCILASLTTSSVERVETYAAGVAPRLPYKAHPNGLILVYMQDGRIP